MKKLYFETSKSFQKFIDACEVNDIKYKDIPSTGDLYVVMIDDNLINDEFLYNNGY